MAELRATYRLQLTPDFGFAAARELVPYLRDLGISHLYLSPTLQARPGSTHGYDAVDPAKLSADLGGEAEFRALAAAASDAGLGLVLDVVPNHMAADEANRYWADPELRERFFDLDPVSGRWRRFFDIDELAALRQEREEVFGATHEKLLALVAEGLVDGLRVDHPDGLANPRAYLERLRDAGVSRVWVEKILDPGEPLRDWPVCGTVGYEFLNDACALFVDPAGEAPLTELWTRISGDGRPFGEVAAEAKLEQARGTFTPEIERLARVRGDDPAALSRAVSSLPVYRAYVEPDAERIEPADREALAPVEPAELRAALLLDAEAPAELVTRFQQTTPAIMAKGVEDTAFYRYGRLLALNDVGGDPSRFGLSVADFHAANRQRAERFPENLLTTQTHDAKRSADVRLRIATLASAGLREDWVAAVDRWLELTEPLRTGGAPDDAERLFIFQTLAGAWPIERERVTAYMEKALREAKRNTNWVEPNGEWEGGVTRFVEALYDHSGFRAELTAFAERLARSAEPAVLGQVVLKLTCPGVPDIYQGDELEFRALVDPDNRRPVDFGWRQAMLRRLMGGSPPDAETRKLFCIMRLLGLRARRPGCFGPQGGYEALDAGEEICAYRRGEDVWVAVAVRPGAAARADPIETPSGRWRDVLRGEEHDLGKRTPADWLLSRRGIGVYERL